MGAIFCQVVRRVRKFHVSVFVTLRNHKWNGITPIFRIKIILRMIFSFLDTKEKNFNRNKASNSAEALD